MEINIKWTVCRICLREEHGDSTNGSPSKMRQIDSKVAKQIYDCTGVSIKCNDNLPEKICGKCFRLLKYSISFRNSCRNSDDYLKSIIKTTKSATSFFQMAKRDSSNGTVEIDDFEEILLDIDGDPDDTCDSATADKSKEAILTTSASGRSDCSQFKIYKENENESNTEQTENDNISDSQNKMATKDEAADMNMYISTNRRKANNDIIEFYKMSEDLTDKNADNVNTPRATSECSNGTENFYDEDGDNLDENTAQFDNYEDFDVVEKKSSRTKNNFSLKSARNTEKFYYLLNSDAKNEYHNIDEGSMDEETIELIPMESLDGYIKSEQNSVSADDIEFIVEGTDYDCSKSDAPSPSTPVESVTKTRNERTKKKRGDFICDVCANHFTSRNLLNYHMRIHRNEKNYECELCFKRFNAGCNLTAHMRVHTGEKPFECQFCGRKFADRSTHIKHERVHTNEKPFTCNVCGKSFSLSTTLKAHEKVHTGEKPFKCEPCHKSFKLAHQLKAHFKSHLHKTIAIDN